MATLSTVVCMFRGFLGSTVLAWRKYAAVCWCAHVFMLPCVSIQLLNQLVSYIKFVMNMHIVILSPAIAPLLKRLADILRLELYKCS
jgi:hypothetical protein